MTPPVEPILVQIGNIPIHWYGLLVVTGILLGTQIASYLAKRAGEDPERVWDLLLIAVIFGIIGARIEYVLVKPHWTYFQQHLAEAFYIWRGGLRIYGAIIGGALGTLIYAHFAHVNPFQYLDFAAPGMAMGHAIGRWGNFINYELYGPPTNLPWGLHIPAEYRIGLFRDVNLYPLDTRFHPAFLYESVANLILCIALLVIADRFRGKIRHGTIVIGYLIGYSVIRFLMDYMRTDDTSAQGIALGFIIASSALLVAWYLPRKTGVKAN
jgi:phosphatidylglycerol:prolipoprotein diacylglycerol transferase